MKEEQCFGWKVIVSGERCSTSNWFGKNPYRVFYPVNVSVTPDLAGSKLFFFRDENLANIWLAKLDLQRKHANADVDSYNQRRKNVSEEVKECPPFILVKCVATNPTIFTEKIVSQAKEIQNDFVRYWFALSGKVDLSKTNFSNRFDMINYECDWKLKNASGGTWVADSIMCLE